MDLLPPKQNYANKLQQSEDALLNVCPVQFRLDCSGEMLSLSCFQIPHIELALGL